MTYLDDKPPLDELAHHGVKGMKWGQRKAVTASDIHDARARLDVQAAKYSLQAKKAKKAKGTSSGKAESRKLDQMTAAYLKNPDRATALRMTRGEKFLTILGSSLILPGVGTVLGTGAVLTRTAVANNIEKKQATGAYNKKK